MGFIKSRFNSVDRYLRDVHQDRLAIFLTVHDEVVFAVDDRFKFTLMTSVSRIAENKKIMDSLGYPFMNPYFDLEYDLWGSYTAKLKCNYYGVDGFNLNDCSDFVFCDSQESKVEPKEVIFYLDDDLQSNRLIAGIKSSLGGSTRVVVELNGERYISNDLIIWDESTFSSFKYRLIF